MGGFPSFPFSAQLFGTLAVWPWLGVESCQCKFIVGACWLRAGEAGLVILRDDCSELAELLSRLLLSVGCGGLPLEVCGGVRSEKSLCT